MGDFITYLNELLKMTADISIWRLVFFVLAAVVCILAWQSPLLLKAYLDYKKHKGGDSE